MKKLLCTILALVLTAALPFSAMAADKITLGIAQFAEHGSLDNCREGFLAGLAADLNFLLHDGYTYPFKYV